MLQSCHLFFFFNDTATTEIYTLSLHDALPIYGQEEGVAEGADSSGYPSRGAGPPAPLLQIALQLPEPHGPEGRTNTCGRVVAVSGDPQPAVIPPGNRCRGTVLTPERAEVQHPPVWRPEKGACDWLAAAIGLPRLARPDDIAEIVDVISTARPPADGAQSDDPGLLGPQKRPPASTHDLAPVVDAKRHARGSPEGSEIAHPVRGGPERSEERR